MYELAQHVEQYDYLLREEKISKAPSRGTIYKNPTADAIFDQLLSARIIKLRPGHNIPMVEELKGNIYCKYHNSSKHTTNKYVVFRDNIQSWIDNGKLRFPEKKMSNPRPCFTADFRSNKPPTVLTGPAIVKPMIAYSTNDEGGSVLLCRKCKANVNAEPKEKLSLAIVEQPTAVTQQKVLNVGQHQRVFNRLGPKVQVEETPPVRRRLDFDASFYDEDYYVRNSSSSESSKCQKTFKPPEPRDQRWYTYHSSKGVYTTLSKSQKRLHQRIDCMARRRAAQETSVPKWRPKETFANDDERPSPTIMTELVQGKRLVS
ncbi:hypothetical protein ACFX1W_003325 [Malus domestica]